MCRISIKPDKWIVCHKRKENFGIPQTRPYHRSGHTHTHTHKYIRKFYPAHHAKKKTRVKTSKEFVVIKVGIK
jgi:hypothetical protein